MVAVIFNIISFSYKYFHLSHECACIVEVDAYLELKEPTEIDEYETYEVNDKKATTRHDDGASLQIEIHWGR